MPAPVEELLEVEGWTRDHHGGDVSEFEVRHGQLESARLAFLFALEILEPRGRAVLILRDVLGYSGPEVGAFLGLTVIERFMSAILSGEPARVSELLGVDFTPPPAA